LDPMQKSLPQRNKKPTKSSRIIQNCQQHKAAARTINRRLGEMGLAVRD
jgi:hypothetical protein